MVQLGHKVHHYTIVATAYKSNDPKVYVILGESDNEYVTGLMHPDADNEWFWGHYIQKGVNAFSKAFTDFTSRTR